MPRDEFEDFLTVEQEKPALHAVAQAELAAAGASHPPASRGPVVSFIGAGNYAGRVLIPAFKSAGVELDTVVTNGGVLGKVTEVGDAFITVEVANNVQIKIQKHAVSAVMPKGTIKST